MPRDDISAALSRVPPHVGHDILNQTPGALAFVNGNLPADEQVLAVSSAAPQWFEATRANSILFLTAHRLIFVAPAPQVLSWPLRSITKAQVLDGSGIVGFLLDAEGAEFQLGIDGSWGSTFVAHVKHAAALATIRNL